MVVTHGLDTVEETAFPTDLLAGPAAHRGGIVFTGAVRPLDALSGDGPCNLASSLVAAADPALRGVGAVVCAGDELHAARWVTMADATAVTALSSAPAPVLGRVADGGAEMFAAPPPRPSEPEGEPETNVALIKTYPEMDPVLLTAVGAIGVRGLAPVKARYALMAALGAGGRPYGTG